MVKVMAINAGSSSLKFQLINMPSEEVITSGLVERIGLDQGNFEMKYNGEKFIKECPIKDHSVAVQLLLDALVDHHIVESLGEIEACGHRVVHGGEYYNDAVKVDEEVVARVEELAELAPLHNPAHIVGYNAFKAALPEVEHVFVFDTAFHQTLDRERYLYPLPYEYYTDLKVRKYGAHGTSHKYVSQVAIDMLGNPKHSRVIVCHLGNGASISAVQDGICIDTSMALFKNGDERALLTGLLYARIVSKYIGSYFVEMGGVDAIAFTAGVGENASYLRRLIIDNVSRALGVFLNEEENERRSKENRLISHQYSKVDVYVIPTNEEVMIARDTVRILGL